MNKFTRVNLELSSMKVEDVADCPLEANWKYIWKDQHSIDESSSAKSSFKHQAVLRFTNFACDDGNFTIEKPCSEDLQHNPSDANFKSFVYLIFPSLSQFPFISNNQINFKWLSSPVPKHILILLRKLLRLQEVCRKRFACWNFNLFPGESMLPASHKRDWISV